jgi:O-methyltransferase
MIAQLYLDLLKKALTRYSVGTYEPIAPVISDAPTWVRFMYPILKRFFPKGWDLARAVDPTSRMEGFDTPFVGETMIGLLRLDNIQDCIAQILKDGIVGDLIEAGVWRGGAVIFMRAALEAFGDKERKVWVADSFQGLPKPNADKYPADNGIALWKVNFLAVPLEDVKKNFELYGMLDDRVKFLPGWFKDTLPTAPIERLALMRLDGDLYESTTDCLKALYPKLSIGGYVIIDDYHAIPASAQATDDFRREHGITEDLVKVDWTCVYWRKGH